uniref:Uncharacterized protein n=1 Tax=Anopheles atroparvus TaxID=41427 RepID=A0A182IXD3_ANOAO
MTSVIKDPFQILSVTNHPKCGKHSRHYPRYSLNSSDNEDSSPIHRSIYAQPYNAIAASERQSNFTYRPAAAPKGIGSQGTGISTGGQSVVNPLTVNTTPSSENGSSATLTDAEASLLVNNDFVPQDFVSQVQPKGKEDLRSGSECKSRVNTGTARDATAKYRRIKRQEAKSAPGRWYNFSPPPGGIESE